MRHPGTTETAAPRKTPYAPRLDAQDRVFRTCPHSHLDDLRKRDPIHLDERLGRVVLTRAADVASLFADRRLSSDPYDIDPAAYGKRPEGERIKATMLTLDDPDHGRLRKLFLKALNARSVEAMRPKVESIAERLLDDIDPERSFDLIETFATPLPILVIAAVLGIDDADVPQFKRWSDDAEIVFLSRRSEDQQTRLAAAFGGLDDMFTRAIRERRRRPRPDLMTELVAAEADGDKLTEAEIVNNCRLLLTAGNLTTTDLIGNAVVALLQHPDQLARLRADAALWPAAVEELLRYDPPVAHWNRHTPVDLVVAGRPVEARQTVTGMILAANHDPALHERPHDLDLDRRDQRHYSFGGGQHYCLGASLAKLELTTALQGLFRRFPAIELLSLSERKDNPPFNGFRKVELRVSSSSDVARR